jgi:predicted RNase H-like HicB family nuclease
MKGRRRSPSVPGRRRKRRCVVLIESGPRNFSAWVPDLPGCVAAGRTRSETIRLMRGALRVHLDAMARDGDPIPEAAIDCDTVEV